MAREAQHIKYDPTRTDTRWTVSGSHTITYDVVMSANLLDVSNRDLAHWCGASDPRAHKVLAVIDERVAEVYSTRIASYFERSGLDYHELIISGDEKHKQLATAELVAAKMNDVGLLRRAERVVVFGGGVVMDVVGMAANLFRRGVPYVRVPTTLIGQVDAGVGVKTGVNHGVHKNRLGTYYAPISTLIDPAFLSTVPERHIINGLAEIIKISLIKDADLFDLMETTSSRFAGADFASGSEAHAEIMRRAIVGMLAELEPNLHETELERSVDYGHTFSPALELIANPPLLHGEAVSVDMAICVGIAARRGLLDADQAHRVIRLLVRVGLPVSHGSFTSGLLESALVEAVRHRDGAQRIPLMRGMGDVVFVNDVTAGELHAALLLIADIEESVRSSLVVTAGA